MGKNTIGDVNGEIINIIQNSGIFSKYISNDNKIELSKDLDITPPLPAKVIKKIFNRKYTKRFIFTNIS